MTRRYFPDRLLFKQTAYTLPLELRDHIETALHAHQQPLPPEAFWAALATAIGRYHADRKAESLSRKPAQMRETLTDALKTAAQLQKQLKEIERYNLPTAKGGRGDIRHLRIALLEGLKKQLLRIKTEAVELPNGRLPDYAKMVISATIAHLIRQYLKTEPTTTPHGLFAELIEIVTGSADKGLLSKAIKTEVGDGTFHFSG